MNADSPEAIFHEHVTSRVDWAASPEARAFLASRRLRALVTSRLPPSSMARYSDTLLDFMWKQVALSATRAALNQLFSGDDILRAEFAPFLEATDADGNDSGDGGRAALCGLIGIPCTVERKHPADCIDDRAMAALVRDIQVAHKPRPRLLSAIHPRRADTGRARPAPSPPFTAALTTSPSTFPRHLFNMGMLTRPPSSAAHGRLAGRVTRPASMPSSARRWGASTRRTS